MKYGMPGNGNEMIAGWNRTMIRFAPPNSSDKDTINRDKCAHTATNIGQPIDREISRRGVAD